MSMEKAAIGIFDSGIGGLTVWRELLLLLPSENTIYLSDAANAPYGEKSVEEIYQLSRKNTQWLLEKGCKLIVVACNTATTNAISRLRNEFNVPFIGIEPAIKPAALQSRSKRIGVLATRGTLASNLFSSTSASYTAGIEVIGQEGTGLVGLIEKGLQDSENAREHLAGLLSPMLDRGIDHLVLGCTHYPLLIPQLRELLPESVQIVDCGPAVARQTRAVLEAAALLNPSGETGTHQLYTNADPAVINRVLKEMGKPEKADAAEF